MSTTKTTTTSIRVEFTDKLILQDLVDLIKECDDFPMNSVVTLRSPKRYQGEPGVDPGVIEIISRSKA